MYNIKTQLLKYNGTDWNADLVELRRHQLAILKSKIYELSVQHGVACKCCRKIIPYSTTHPTDKEVQNRSHKPGRPRFRRGV